MECPHLPSPSQAVDAPEGSGGGGQVPGRAGSSSVALGDPPPLSRHPGEEPPPGLLPAGPARESGTRGPQ